MAEWFLLCWMDPNKWLGFIFKKGLKNINYRQNSFTACQDFILRVEKRFQSMKYFKVPLSFLCFFIFFDSIFYQRNNRNKEGWIHAWNISYDPKIHIHFCANCWTLNIMTYNICRHHQYQPKAYIFQKNEI